MKNFKKIILLFCVSLFSANCMATVDAQKLGLTSEFETLLATLLKKYPKNSKLKILDDAELQKGKCDHPECCQKRLAVNRAAQKIYLKNTLEAIKKYPNFLDCSYYSKPIMSGLSIFILSILIPLIWVNYYNGNKVVILKVLNEFISVLWWPIFGFSAFLITFGHVLDKLDTYIEYSRGCYLKKPWFDSALVLSHYAQVSLREGVIQTGHIIFYSESVPSKVEIRKYCGSNQQALLKTESW